MKRPGQLACLGALLALLCWLAERHVVSLLAWTARVFPISHYRWLLLLYLAGCLALAVSRPIWRRAILLALSLATAAVFSLAFLALSVAWIWLYHRVLMARVRTRWKIAFVALTFAGWTVACDAALFPRFLAGHPAVGVFGYVFAVGYTFRIVWVLHELHQTDFPRVPLLDLLLYLLFAPFFIVIPYMFVIPRFGRFREGLDQPRPEVARSGLRALAVGIAIEVAVHFACRLYAPDQAFQQALRQHHWLWIWPLGLLRYPIYAVLSTIGGAGILLGLVRILGIDVAPAFVRPLGATSVTEWWRRWNVHFRDLLVNVCFYPVMLRLRRRPYLAIVAGTAAVFLVGSTLMHGLTKHYFRYGSHLRLPLDHLTENAAMTIIVAAALCLEQRRRRRPARPPGSLRRLAGLGVTYSLLLASVVVLGNGATYLREVAPRERLHGRGEAARALAAAGYPADAFALMAPALPELRRQIAHQPRDPGRRLELAWALALGPASFRAEASRETETAAGFAAASLDELSTDSSALLAETRRRLHIQPGGNR